mmetsp:Transcript_100289/g.252861  ORF Transcript_100289/g.252861 Transcript_100289/m.252861 type:complete len:296 (+) Transcript_100289:239-1126(+)
MGDLVHDRARAVELMLVAIQRTNVERPVTCAVFAIGVSDGPVLVPTFPPHRLLNCCDFRWVTLSLGAHLRHLIPKCRQLLLVNRAAPIEQGARLGLAPLPVLRALVQRQPKSNLAGHDCAHSNRLLADVQLSLIAAKHNLLELLRGLFGFVKLLPRAHNHRSLRLLWQRELAPNATATIRHRRQPLFLEAAPLLAACLLNRVRFFKQGVHFCDNARLPHPIFGATIVVHSVTDFVLERWPRQRRLRLLPLLQVADFLLGHRSPRWRLLLRSRRCRPLFFAATKYLPHGLVGFKIA